MTIEDFNYYNDPRVRAGQRGDWFKTINETLQTATVELEDEDGDVTFEAEVRIEFEVCPTCSGSGKHVNPSIDCGGLSAEDFQQDPDFLDEYMGGHYDVICYGCGGKRVVAVPKTEGEDQLAENAQLFVQQQEERAQWEAEDYATMMAEMRMGA